jgi:Cu2+-exporting ATPase
MAITKQTFPVRGMTCAACARNVENILKFTDGVVDASVNYAGHNVQVVMDKNLDFGILQKAVQSIGYDLVEKTDVNALRKQGLADLQKLRNKLYVAAAFSLPVFVLSMFFMHLTWGNYAQFVLSLPVIFFSGKHFYISAAKKLRHRQFNMDTLIAMGTGSAFLFSILVTFAPAIFSNAGLAAHPYFESAVVIITLILFGNYLEERAKTATNTAIEKLMQLQPESVWRMNNGELEEVPVEAIMPGDVLRVFPGANVPLDGVVREGSTFVDETMLTGESIPTKKTVGDTVTGGTVNQESTFLLEVTRVGAETTLAKIIKLVQEAQGSKAPAQKLADKISGIFVPIVLGIAAFTAIAWYVFGPEPRALFAFTTAITVLIIACPCALGLATPTAITVGVGKGAGQGILIKDAATFDAVQHITTLLLDKTGTLTEGKPIVTQQFYRDENAEKLRAAVRVAELQSEHPIAKALANALADIGYKVEISDVTVSSGNGISFNYLNNIYHLGKPGWQQVVEDEWYMQHLETLQQANATMVLLSTNKQALVLYGLTDALKQGAKEAVQNIRQLGIKVHMLTGDRREAAEFFSKALHLDGFDAELLPADKLAVVQRLQATGEIVAMAGDGINDAPALAQANVSFAMSTGTDIAMASAGITLLHGDISKIEKAITLSRQTSQTIRQNLFWAFFYNILAIPVAAGILYPFTGFLLNPMIAGGAMAFSSVTVVFNSLLLKRNSF